MSVCVLTCETRDSCQWTLGFFLQLKNSWKDIKNGSIQSELVSTDEFKVDLPTGNKDPLPIIWG